MRDKLLISIYLVILQIIMTQSIKLPQPGDVLNNTELCDKFLCSPQGGMRRSLRTNTLVIVSNHIKSIYDDRWDNDVLHYTGMGTTGVQSLNFAQNKTITESNESQIKLHLFEVFVDREYVYAGEVTLAAEPYFETQPDKNGLSREVCVFPLKLKDGNPAPIDKNHLNKVFETKTRKAKRLSDEEVEQRAKNARKNIGSRKSIIHQHERSPWVAEHAKRLAKGVCQLCEQPAPFKNRANEPFLETHHIIWLAKGGEDTIANTVALCPNCHRKMHVQNDKKDIQKLQAKYSNTQKL
jgi:5-methylcytosine-specific restriction protein A